MSERNDTLQEYFAENPRMMGIAFTIALLLLQAGNAAAANCGTVGGP